MSLRVILVVSAVLIIQASANSLQRISTKAELEERLEQSAKTHDLAVIEFWGPDCKDCEDFHSKTEKHKFDKVNFIEVNVDGGADTDYFIEKYKAKVLPYTVILKDKEMVDSISGDDETKLEDLIKKHLSA